MLSDPNKLVIGTTSSTVAVVACAAPNSAAIRRDRVQRCECEAMSAVAMGGISAQGLGRSARPHRLFPTCAQAIGGLGNNRQA